MNNIVLYQPEIPGNTGNIMRTCVATNTKLHLIRPLGFSLDSAHIKRSGANYVDKVDYTIYDNFEEFRSKNPGKYYYLTRYGNIPHTAYDYSDTSEDIYFIFGRESTGIPKEILKNDLDHCMRIPMTDKVRALNLSNSAAIVIYEALRQQNYEGLLMEEPPVDNMGHKGSDYLEK